MFGRNLDHTPPSGSYGKSETVQGIVRRVGRYQEVTVRVASDTIVEDLVCLALSSPEDDLAGRDYYQQSSADRRLYLLREGDFVKLEVLGDKICSVLEVELNSVPQEEVNSQKLMLYRS